MVLTEKSYDRKLQIQTTGLREWGKRTKRIIDMKQHLILL